MVYRFQYFISDFRFELKEAQIRYCFKWDLTLGQNGQNFTRISKTEIPAAAAARSCLKLRPAMNTLEVETSQNNYSVGSPSCSSASGSTPWSGVSLSGMRCLRSPGSFAPKSSEDSSQGRESNLTSLTEDIRLLTLST